MIISYLIFIIYNKVKHSPHEKNITEFTDKKYQIFHFDRQTEIDLQFLKNNNFFFFINIWFNWKSETTCLCIYKENKLNHSHMLYWLLIYIRYK